MSKQKVNKLQAGSIARVPIASDGVLEREHRSRQGRSVRKGENFGSCNSDSVNARSFSR